MKKKVLFIGACGYNYMIKGGEIAKCRVIDNYLHGSYNTHTIDTYWEKKNIFYVFWKYSGGRVIKLLRIMYWGKWADYVVICSSYSTYLKILEKAHCLHKTYLFGVGGRVPSVLLKEANDARLLKKMAAIFVESETMVSEFSNKGISNARFVPNFKNLPHYENTHFTRSTELKLFFIGKVCEAKGCIDIAEAINDLNRIGVDCSLHLYGVIEPGFPMDNITNDKIMYKGFLDLVDDTTAYEQLREYDVFVFPTKWEGEGFAGALIDAMAVGKPIIASRHKSIPEIVKDGETGLLFNTGDINDLKEKICFFYNDRNQLDEFGKRALIESKKYDTRYVMHNLFGGYNEANR